MQSSILFVALVLAGNGGDDPKARNDLNRLQGDWSVVSCRVGPQRGDTGRNAPARLSFEGDKNFITLRTGKRYAQGATITLDPTKSPRTINFKGGEHEYLGIYEFDGKRLRICYHQKMRPTKFDSEEQQQDPFNALVELERE